MKIYVVLPLLLVCLCAQAIEKLKPYKSVQDFSVCGETHPVKECLAALDVWLAKHETDYPEAAKIVRTNASAEYSVPYYRIAFRQKKVGCMDSDVLETITTGLQTAPGGQIAKDAKSIAFTTCWKEWKGDLIAQLDGAKPEFLRNTCPELLSKKALSVEQTKFCKE